MPQNNDTDASLSRNASKPAEDGRQLPSAYPRRSGEFIPMRNSTFVLPHTGERLKRVITLSHPRAPNTERPAPASEAGRESTSNAEEMGPESPLLATHRKPKRAQRQKKPWYILRERKPLKHEAGVLLRRAWAFTISRAGQGILKCSIAYLLGSMGTFVPFLAEFLGDQDGKHMVATCTVYFHPARSQGSMFEAAFLAAVAFVYAAFVAFTSMGVEILFDRKLDLIVVGHIIVLVVFCGAGLGFVGWIKQKMGNPLVNVACSLTSLAIITVLTKEESVREAEFSPDKIIQVMKMVLMGIVATTLVNFTILPISARKDFRKNLIDITDSLGEMLTMITRGFLTGSEEELEQRGFQEASTRFKSQYAALSKNLREAKWEHYAYGTERQYTIETKLLNCMRRLSQNVGGLRSAATTQFALLAQSHAAGGTTPVTAAYTPTTAGLPNKLAHIDSWISFQENFEMRKAVGSQDDLMSREFRDEAEDDISGLPTARSPNEIFERFIMRLGPSMKSLAFTLKQILDELPYGDDTNFRIAVNPHFRSSLVSAIDLYSNARSGALKLLYRGKALSTSRPAELEADFEEVAASCGYFSFSLQDFGEEMKTYLDILDELKEEMEKPASKRVSWNWLKLWRSGSRKSAYDSEDEDDQEQNNLITDRDEHELQREQPSPAYVQNDNFGRFPKPDRTATFGQRFRKATRFLRRDETKFAVKVGTGAALFALPSFIEDTQPFYEHWRGEWGLLSYMLVCSMTIGASNTTGFSRAWGTVLGAICAVVAWLLSRGNVFLMAFFGWIMALGGFFIIVGQGRGPLGRFILLSYNLTALYAYSLSVRDDEWWDEDEEGKGNNPLIGDIALHRVVAVLAGCLWGLIVTRLIWPISARKKFRNGLSLLLLRMGLIWKRDPLSSLVEGEALGSYMNLKEELELRRYLGRLESLKGAASHEFELRGPFPTAEYEVVLKSVGNMIDAFHALNVIITKDLKASSVEIDLLRYTSGERNQLCSRISHLFQVMASSVKLEFPLNDALPNTENARDRFLAKIFKYRKMHSTSQGRDDEEYALLYAYALVTGQLSKEIYEVTQTMERLFGVLDEDLLRFQ
ncbi:hypothetical protein MMC10_007751 [Thelotrema lepadinum]|nr:hypothetical protein [Thelotrema lepadinum]